MHLFQQYYLCHWKNILEEAVLVNHWDPTVLAEMQAESDWKAHWLAQCSVMIQFNIGEWKSFESCWPTEEILSTSKNHFTLTLQLNYQLR